MVIEPFIESQGEHRGFRLWKPRRIGDRLLIASKGARVAASDRGRAILFLDVRRAFGTGGHGSTEGCLLALERHLRGGEAVLDLGTGTGILAIAARKLGAGSVTALETEIHAFVALLERHPFDVREILRIRGWITVLAVRRRSPGPTPGA